MNTSAVSDADLTYLELTAKHCPAELGTEANAKRILTLLEENQQLFDEKCFIDDLQDRIDTLEFQNAAVQDAVDKAEAQIGDLKQTIRELEEDNEELLETITQLEDELALADR